MSKREVKGLGEDGFVRHYQPQKNYYSNARTSVLEVRKKSLRTTFLTIFAIIIIFYIVSFLGKKEGMDNNSDVKIASASNWQGKIQPVLESTLIAQTAHIKLIIGVENFTSLSELLPMELEFGWQNSYTIFSRYWLTDTTLWDEQEGALVIEIREPAVQGAQFFVRVKSHDTNDFVTLVQTIE